MPVKSLNTTYAGCRFRSRLEARWAVYLDTLGLPWEYETEGFEVAWRLDGSDETFHYLPDFWLPSLNVWGEVKGRLTVDETRRLLNAAASLSCNNEAGCHDAGGYDLAVFGPLTSSTIIGSPVRLHMHKGDLLATCLWCDDPHDRHVVVGNDVEGQFPCAALLLNGFSCHRHLDDHDRALRTARTARFEFGATPVKVRR